MNDPFSEALLREGGLISDRFATLLQTVVGSSLLYNAKLGGSGVGYRMAETVQRSTGKKTYNNRPRGQGQREKKPEQMVLEKQELQGTLS